MLGGCWGRMLSGYKSPHGKIQDALYHGQWQPPDVKELKNKLEDVEEVLAGTTDPLQRNSLTQVGRKLHARSLL